MGINLRKDKLEQKLHEYEIPLDESITWDNEKMIKKLGDYFMSLEPEKYSWGARYVQSLNTVMLCNHLKDNLQYFSYNPVESEDYTVETKMNGFRAICYYSPEAGFEFFSRNESVSNFLNGNFTDKYLFINKGVITEPKDYKGAFNYRFVLDGELIVEGSESDASAMGITAEDYIQQILGSNPESAKAFQKEEHRLKYVVFDILYFEKEPKIPAEWNPVYNYDDPELTKEQIEWVNTHFAKYLEVGGFKSYGRAKPLYKYLYSLKDTCKYDIRRMPFRKRRELRSMVIKFLQKKNIPIFEVDYEDTYKIAFTDNLLREGAEGSMLKALDAPYISALRTNRNHRAAMKIKQSIASMLSEDMSEIKDFDVFIIGATPPKSDRIHDMIGALCCGVYVKNEEGEVKVHEIAKVSGIPHEWKKKMASIDINTGEISLNPEYAYKVIAINGLALTKSNLKFQHATLLEKGKVEFKAKNPTECTWDIEALKSMVITRGQ